jgi:SAM-dependent methyltransferase
MSTIADSTAFRDDSRLLVQHQAALTLLQGFLGNPSLSILRWLDLACGRGQIIAALDQNLSGEARSRIAYFAYDVQHRFVREVERAAGQLGLRGVEAKIGDLEDFGRLVDPTNRFDFITLTNTVHEVSPYILSNLLLDCLRRLTADGCLFIYDMESLDPLELGAIPWTRSEFADILQALFRGTGRKPISSRGRPVAT